MHPIDLTVPEAEHELARRLGARWHMKYAVWCVSPTLNVEPLSRWLTARSFPNVRCNRLWLARTLGACPACESMIPMFGLLLPSSHLVLNSDDDEDEDAWEVAEEPSQLYEIEYLSESPRAVLRAHAPTFRLRHSELLNGFRWMNHCPQCRESIEDGECALAPGSPLGPVEEAEAAAITLKEFQLEFEASCDRLSCGVPYIDAMPRSRA